MKFVQRLSISPSRFTPDRLADLIGTTVPLTIQGRFVGQARLLSIRPTADGRAVDLKLDIDGLGVGLHHEWWVTGRAPAFDPVIVFRLRDGAFPRSVMDVGPGDFLSVEGRWEEIVANPGQGAYAHAPRRWTVITLTGEYPCDQVDRYARRGDFDERA